MTTEQFSQEKLDQETDAMIIQMHKQQQSNWLKAGALILLVLIGFFTVVYVSAIIPKTVMIILG